MKLTREDLEAMLGSKTKRYRQCILTTYVFDPVAFENLLLPQLRRANIRNVVILVDGGQFEKVLLSQRHNWLSGNKGYTIIPVMMSGSFHPKLLLAVGRDEGLLAVGSGNLTSGGMGGNEEIWAAFHRDGNARKFDRIFGDAWHLISKYTSGTVGAQQTTMGWFPQHAPWLKQLAAGAGFVDLDNVTRVRLLSSSGAENMMTVLEDTVGDDEMESLTVIAPYFDRDGRALDRLLTVLAPDDVQCLVDTNFSGFPAELDTGARSQVQWKNWKAKEDSNEWVYRPLHAKLIHLRTPDREILLMGSANCSAAALGEDNKPSRNAEASLLIERRGSGNYLKELGLDLSACAALHQVDLTGLQREDAEEKPEDYRPSNRITYAEQNADQFTYQLAKEPQQGVSIRRISDAVRGTSDHEAPVTKSIATLPWPDDSGGQLIALYHSEERISPYTLITDVQDVRKANPDTYREELEAVLTHFKDHNGRDGIENILKFLDIQREYQEEPSGQEQRAQTGFVTVSTASARNGDAAALSPEEFRQRADETALFTSEASTANETGISIALFLNELLRSIKQDRKADDNNEQVLLQVEREDAEGESDVEAEAETPTADSSIMSSQDAKAIQRYLKRVMAFLTDKTVMDRKNFGRKPFRKEKELDSVELPQYASIAAAFSLLLLYHNKRYYTDDKREETADFCPQRYAGEQGSEDLPAYLYALIGGLRQVLGNKPNWVQASGSANSMSERASLLRGLVENCVYAGYHLVSRCQWSRSNLVYRDLLYLDLLSIESVHFNRAPEAGRLLKELEHLRIGNHQADHYRKQVRQLRETLLPNFHKWFTPGTASHAADRSDVREDTICYAGSVGFYLLKNSTSTDITVIKPGLTGDFKRGLNPVRYGKARGKLVIWAVADVR
jgi:hypothetical protein